MDARHPKSAAADFGTKIAEIGSSRFRLLAAILRDASLRDAPQDEAVIFGRPFMTREPVLRGLPIPFDLTGRRIFVAGHRGMVGAALVRRLKSERCEVLTAARRVLDLTRQADTEDWLRDDP